MAARSTWKGHIKFSLVTIPVKMFKATDDSDKVSFHQLHKGDGGRVRQKNVCGDCGEELTPGDIVKGYEVGPGEHVVIDKADLDAVKLESNKMIELQGFVGAEEIHPSIFESPGFLAPDGVAAFGTYALLRDALESSSSYGIGRLVARGREQVVAIAPYEHGLMVYNLRNPDSVRNISDLPGVEEAEANPMEVELAQNLVESMTCSLGDLDLSDRYQSAVRSMVDAKVNGGDTVESSESVPASKPGDVMAALRASVAAASDAKVPAKKAAPAKKKAVAKKAPAKAKAKRKSKAA